MSTSARFSHPYWHLALIVAVLIAFGMSTSPAAACGGCGSVEATKTVSGTYEAGSLVTYTIVLTNTMPWNQGDNPGDELSDVLPSSLELVSAGASSGSAVATIGTNTVSWNGSIPSSGSVTIAITATIKAGTTGQIVSNQGVVSYDAYENGSNEVTDVTDDPLTIAFGDATDFTVAAAPETPVEVEVVEAPPPPATPLCDEHNFNENGVVHSSSSDALGSAINCRVIYQNGAPTSWIGGDLYSPASIGVEGIVELGIVQAVDIFSPGGQNYFEGGSVFCLRGEGTLIWLAASQSPRHAEVIGSYSVPEFEGFTCATLFEPGTLVLVSQNPLDR